MAGADADGDRRNVSDVVGVLVLGACAAWSLITAAAHGGRPEGVLLALLAVAAGYAAGRISGALVPVAAPCAAALAGLGLTMGLPRLAPGPEIVGPLGHAGATAALLTLATGAACCAAWTTGSPVARVLLRLLAVGIAVASAALGSVSGLVTCTAVLLCSLAAGRMRHRGPGIAGLALAATTVTGLTWAVAGDAVPDGLAESLRGRLTPHRIGLWHDALHLARQDTALGVGPGRFGELSTTAAQSPAARRQTALGTASDGRRAGRDRGAAAGGGLLLAAVRAVALPPPHAGRPHRGRGPDGAGGDRRGRQRAELHDGVGGRRVPGGPDDGPPPGRRGAPQVSDRPGLSVAGPMPRAAAGRG
ncbi:hypothetical protein M2160_007329 [Streptomyces sp. SAI-117]|nr:hypothetical protein [Streptomyces sp. SAI-117]